MNIAILGTKGIPNQYGGFEQFAEYLSKGLVERGHNVTVYNPHFHAYGAKEFHGVKIEKIYSPEKLIGSAANYVYDFLCLRHALAGNYDIIYEAGYGSVAFSYLLLPVNRSILVTNMDGLEWKRAKWNSVIKYLTKKAEETAVKKSHYLISDNPGIQDYYRQSFNTESFYLPYGADVIDSFDPVVLGEYNLKEHGYYLVIARMEPENNIEMIVRAFQQSDVPESLVLIGNVGNDFGKKMVALAKDPRIRFIGGLYNKKHLDSLRHFSKGYLHGHSVGGTNPSLLEAMACYSLVIAHDNPFNRSVLEDSALYFKSTDQLSDILKQQVRLENPVFNDFKRKNGEKIVQHYNWQKIIVDHETLFQELVARKRSTPGKVK